MKHRAACGYAAFALVSAVLPAAAADFQSVYTDIDLDQCTLMEAYELGATFACPGYKGYPLYVAEGDLRFFVSFGFDAPNELAARQTIPAFNTIGAKLEWRLSNASGEWRPVASILRYFSDRSEIDEDPDQTLIVTKIEPGNTCHIAYIDALLVENANEEARRWADSTAADFQCGKDEPAWIPS